MTAKEQGLSVDELAQLIRVIDGRHTMGAGALAEALHPHILAALASDTGERGVDAIEAIDKMLAAYAKVGGPVDGQLHTRHEIDLARQALAALRAQPAGGGESLGADGSLTYAGQRKVTEHMTVEIRDAIDLLQVIQQRAEAIDCQPIHTPPESGGQGEIVAMVCNAPAFGKGFYQWVKSDAILPIGTKLYAAAPAQPDGVGK